MEKNVGFRGEFMLDHASVRSIWNQISTSRGLSEWLAPKVDVSVKHIKIDWDGEGDLREATIVERDPDHFIKWVWDDDERSFVTMEIVKTELTSTVSLLVEDNDVEMETDVLRELWEYHIEQLRRTLGID